MASFPRLEVLNTIHKIGMVPVFYHPDFEVAKQVIKACAAGGARVIEFTNRGDNAYRVFSDLCAHFAKEDPSIILGVGSVLDAPTGALYISSGANFVVGSVFNPELARLCNRRKVSYSPGCGSASEISQAEELGVEIVKIFPGDAVGGPAFVKGILGPTPWTRIMVTGGVEATKESIFGWFKAGVTAVGMGSQLVRKEWLKAGDYDAMRKTTAQVLAWIREAKGQSVFSGVEHVGLYPTKDAEGTAIARWYADMFGFSYEEGNSSVLVRGKAFGFLEMMKREPGSPCHVAVYTEDIEAAMETLKAKGIEFLEPNFKEDAKIVYLKQRDPAGNSIHLVWRK